jgi:hypothetical protein
MKFLKQTLLFIVSATFIHSCDFYRPVVSIEEYRHYIEAFNSNDDEIYKLGEYPNDKAWEFMRANIPLFDCPDKQLEETYYFRWWTYRKHIRKTPEGFIITEFLPGVPWAGPYNAISCPAAHHFYEGRWLRNDTYLRDYARFWLERSGKEAIRSYSFWIADALLNFNHIHPDNEFLNELFPALEWNFAEWERTKRDSTGLFWQIDDRDGMEMSISGSYGNPKGYGYRPTINSYMYGDISALASMAELLGMTGKSKFYRCLADTIRDNINNRLWDSEATFYKVIPMNYENRFSDAREQHGYTPWYFNIPDEGKDAAWSFLMKPEHFYTQYGPTSAEQCHPLFAVAYTGHECQWNGPSWPFATSVTLTGLANYLNNESNEKIISRKDYFTLLSNYSRSHRITWEDGSSQPWIDENLNPFTGDWISRTRLKTWKDGSWDSEKGGIERGKDYNHSTFADLVISGLIGIRPGPGNTLTVNPLVPRGEWDYFCLEGIPYKKHLVTICYDATGKRYKRGKGFYIYVDGKQIYRSKDYGNVTLEL